MLILGKTLLFIITKPASVTNYVFQLPKQTGEDKSQASNDFNNLNLETQGTKSVLLFKMKKVQLLL